MYGRPMTIEDYYASEMIADPYQKLDCCLETDGGAAVLLTTRERAQALSKQPVTVAAVAEGHPESPDDLTNRRQFLTIGLAKAAPRAFQQAGIAAAEIDAAMIYDCFTFEVIHQLEAAGFCDTGGGGEFLKREGIGIDGRLPVNPHGGLMSEGHMLGMNHILEGVRQLRGECGGRQLPDPRWVAVTGWGDFGDGTIALLRNDRA
jgi:acetyl-CoA acetyltransferase